MSSINNPRSTFKSNISAALLINGVANNDGAVGSHLLTGSNGNVFSDLVHRGGSDASDPQRLLHFSSLPVSGSLGVFSQGFGSTPKLRRIASQDSGDNRQNERSPYDPPFWRRIVIGLLGMFGGAWLYGQGWYNFYK